MKPFITASLLLASTTLTACATDDVQGEEMDIEIMSQGGKSDAVDGKRLRIRSGFEISPWYNFEDAQFEELSNLARVKSVKVDVATNDTVVVSGNMFTFPGTAAETAIAESPWFGDKILNVSVEAAPGAKTAGALGFVMFDRFVENGKMIGCIKSGKSTNFFKSVAIDLVAREVHVDDADTYTFTQCGIAPNGTALGDGTDARGWNFGTYVLPLETTGSLKGTFNYKLKADLI